MRKKTNQRHQVLDHQAEEEEEALWASKYSQTQSRLTRSLRGLSRNYLSKSRIDG